ncbi:MAG: DUF2066 domain-containing protein [Moraxellaceae bacterium]|nr:MAG: DUF2066 domain-containing protein [Moraxellaceae bacterium]
MVHITTHLRYLLRLLFRIRLLYVASMLFILSSTTVAQSSNDIYRIETQVANQSEAERTAAAKATLGDVILGVTGDAAAIQHPLVQQAIKEAPNYLNKFSYVNDANTKTGVKLVLNYSQQAITKLLQQAQLVAVATSSQQGFPLQVNNVNTFADFKHVQAYLKTIGTVRRAELVSVNKQSMLFTLMLDGDVSMLKTTLNAAGKMQVVEGETATGMLNVSWQSHN